MRTTATFRSAFLIFSLGFLLVGPLAIAAGEIRCIEVSDGDTLQIETADGVRQVQLWGIDAPELAQSWGPEARQFLQDRVLNQVVTLEEVDSGQSAMKATVYVDGEDIAAAMVDQGLVWLPEDGDTSDDYARMTMVARLSNRGIWSDPNRLHPAKWREQQRALQLATPTPTPRPVSLSDIADDIDIGGSQGKGDAALPVAISNESVQSKRIILPDTEYGRCINTNLRSLQKEVETVRTSITEMKIPQNDKRFDALKRACSEVERYTDEISDCPREGSDYLHSGGSSLREGARSYEHACYEIFRKEDVQEAWKSLVKGDALIEEARIEYARGLAYKEEAEERRRQYDRYRH